MIRLYEIAPDTPRHIAQLAAELLACADPDAEKRRHHRFEKLASFPAEHQAEVRDTVNRVIKARARHP